MKKYLTLAFLIATMAAVSAQSSKQFTAPMKPARGPQTGALKPPPLRKGEARGVLPRAFQRGGNPLQMLNPKAPARYGSSQDSIAYDPLTGRWRLIKLFEFVF